MARPRYPKSSGPLPPPLVPATRTVGQLVAETLRLYGSRFFVALPLGLVVAVADQASLGLDVAGAIAVLLIASPFLSAAYAAAAALAVGKRPSARTWAVAIGAGTLVFVPAAFLFPSVRDRSNRCAGALRQRRPRSCDRGARPAGSLQAVSDGRPRGSRARSRRPGNARPHVRAEQARNGISAPPDCRQHAAGGDLSCGYRAWTDPVPRRCAPLRRSRRSGGNDAGRSARRRVAEHDAAK